jgi:hypothetical protein
MRRLDSPWTLPADLARVKSLIFCISLLLTVSCGYRSQLTGAGESAALSTNQPPRSREQTSIAVLSLRNDSPEPWLDRIVADALRREIGSRASFDLMNDPRGADLIVRGRIRPLATKSQSFSRFVAALEYGLTLELDLEVVLASGNVVRLDSRTLSESDVYLASPDIEVTRTNRLEVLRRLSDILAVRLADSIEMLDRPIPAGPTDPETGSRKVSLGDRG